MKRSRTAPIYSTEFWDTPIDPIWGRRSRDQCIKAAKRWHPQVASQAAASQAGSEGLAQVASPVASQAAASQAASEGLAQAPPAISPPPSWTFEGPVHQGGETFGPKAPVAPELMCACGEPAISKTVETTKDDRILVSFVHKSGASGCATLF